MAGEAIKEEATAMKLLILIALFCTSAGGCIKAKTVELHKLKRGIGYSYFIDAQGLTVVILYDDAVYTNVIKDLCKTPCAIETVGELLILEPLVRKEK